MPPRRRRRRVAVVASERRWLQRLQQLRGPGTCVDALVPLLDPALLIDDHADSLRALRGIGVRAVRGPDLPIGVREQREVEVELLGEGLVVRRGIERDADDRGALGVVLRSEGAEPATFRGSAGRVGLRIEPKHDLLPRSWDSALVCGLIAAVKGAWSPGSHVASLRALNARPGSAKARREHRAARCYKSRACRAVPSRDATPFGTPSNSPGPDARKASGRDERQRLRRTIAAGRSHVDREAIGYHGQE